jgi:NAD(P)H-quinone oxidoreductase subunit 5
MILEQLIDAAGVVTVLAPLVLLVGVALTLLGDRPMSERATAQFNYFAVVVGFLAAIMVLALMLISGKRNVVLEVGDWLVIPQEHFHFHLKFMFDRLSVPFVILSYVLLGTIGAFASQYLHREPGYHRFFLLYAVFLVGMIVASLAGTIETLFLGWELVGL